MKSLVYFILTLSVLFNLLFSAGFVKARSEARHGEVSRDRSVPDRGLGGARPDRGPGVPGPDTPSLHPRVVRELDLTPEQRDVFMELQQSMREDESALNGQMAEVRRALAEELRNPTLRVEVLRELILRQADLGRQRRVIAADRFSDFLQILTPDQTRKVAQQMLRTLPKQGPDERRPPEHLLRRHDKDGDGRLDRSEWEAAQRELDSRRRDHEQHRAELRQRFDLDQDGELSPAEAAEMRQWLLEHRRLPQPQSADAGDESASASRPGSD